MKFSILIVDDEEIIRQGIIARLNYLGYSYLTMYSAESGTKALQILEHNIVNIIITDIKMPDMTGLELIQKVQKQWDTIKFVILSGYAEFSYAEQAIRFGVKSYLLKPISNEELHDTIQKILEQIEYENTTKKILQYEKRITRENKNYLLEKNINMLLCDANLSLEEASIIKKAIESYFPMKNKKIIAALIHIDGTSYEKGQFRYEDNSLIRFSIINVFEEIPTNSSKIICNHLSNTNQLFAILCADEKEQLIIEAEKVLSNIQSILWNRMHISISIGISQIKETLSFEAMDEAKEAFLQRMIHGTGNLYFYEDIRVLSSDLFPTAELTMLGQYIERGDLGNIQFMVNTIFSDDKIKKVNISYIRIIWFRIINMLFKSPNTIFAKEKSDKSGKLTISYEDLTEFSSIEEFRKEIYEVIVHSLCMDQNMDINARNKIKLAMKFIEENYNIDIAINDLSERFLMSPNYFSSLFKKETGVTTIQFIKELRLKKAKEYLVSTDKSVVEIAKIVGYEDSQYFFKLFKKATGRTPLQYRKELQK